MFIVKQADLDFWRQFLKHVNRKEYSYTFTGTKVAATESRVESSAVLHFELQCLHLHSGKSIAVYVALSNGLCLLMLENKYFSYVI